MEFSEAKFYKPSGSQQLTSEKYELFNGTPTTIVEGDYIITGNYGDSKYAMSNDDSNNSFKGKTDFQMDGNANIVTDDKTIVWHIAPNGDNWTIQSLDDKQYAAYIGSSDGVTMTSTLDDKAFWSYNGNNGFTNKAYNANLYFNNGYFSLAYITGGNILHKDSGQSFRFCLLNAESPFLHRHPWDGTSPRRRDRFPDVS